MIHQCTSSLKRKKNNLENCPESQAIKERIGKKLCEARSRKQIARCFPLTRFSIERKTRKQGVERHALARLHQNGARNFRINTLLAVLSNSRRFCALRDLVNSPGIFIPRLYVRMCRMNSGMQSCSHC